MNIHWKIYNYGLMYVAFIFFYLEDTQFLLPLEDIMNSELD
jgi:hypothetical protein